MAKISAPMLSIGAAGTIADALTFSTWKGRPYTKRKPTPHDPHSARQKGFRAVMTWLAAQWTTLSTANQDTWQQLDPRKPIPGYNRFVGTNLNRIFTGRGPTKASPAAEAGTLGNWSPAIPKNTDAINGLLIDVGFAPLNDVWGVEYFLSPVETFDATLPELHRIQTFTEAIPPPLLLVNVPNGLWWNRCRCFTTDGVISDPTEANDGNSLPP